MKKKRTYTETEQQADILLQCLRYELDAIADISKRAEKETTAVNARYARILAPHSEALKGFETEIRKLMKSEKAVLFREADVVHLLNGSLIRNEEDKVTIPKNAVELAEAEGLTAIIKIVKSIDREKVEKWPDAKLARIGASRKPKETFSYDVKGKE